MKNTIITWISSAAVLSLTAVTLSAASQSFDFEDPKGVNNAQFKLDAPLESITGTANGISGTVHFDKAAPERTRGRIVVDSASLTVGDPSLQGDLLVLRADFTINRSDFGIQPGQQADTVAETIEISLAVAGGALRE